ncbi:glycosyltransferase, partial [Prochlorococcus sp. AH-736-K09]|nr:glycosyltransferase [Prochlorococcus sp. AH-736-K09]
FTKRKIKMIICGNGDLLIDVEKLLLNNKYLNYKIFKNLNEDKLSEIYTISDTLLLLSKNEPWGMVINEAMIHNLSIIASEEVEAANFYKNRYQKCTIKKLNFINNHFLKKHLENLSLKKNNLIDPVNAKTVAKEIFDFINL